MIKETQTGKVLRFLSKKPGAYGLEIVRGCGIETHGVYTVLHRMEQRGLIVAKWGTSVLGARRKHYTIRRR